ncbi:hypothetical protein SH2C18_46240 [Clostridium sediminicola]|uniref:hypothetical protein n=1 Tax=Clostridium sediminicola TaxID=3114879 RepID=UPI0031F26A84
MFKSKLIALLLGVLIIANSNNIFVANAAPVNGWNQNGQTWEYYKEGVIQINSWIQDSSNKWYYLSKAGTMKTGWLEYNGKWYYLNTDGSMLSNTWLDLNGKSYYLSNNGDMMANCITPDGYNVGDDGAWDGKLTNTTSEKSNNNPYKDNSESGIKIPAGSYRTYTGSNHSYIDSSTVAKINNLIDYETYAYAYAGLNNYHEIGYILKDGNILVKTKGIHVNSDKIEAYILAYGKLFYFSPEKDTNTSESTKIPIVDNVTLQPDSKIIYEKQVLGDTLEKRNFELKRLDYFTENGKLSVKCEITNNDKDYENTCYFILGIYKKADNDLLKEVGLSVHDGFKKGETKVLEKDIYIDITNKDDIYLDIYCE